MTTQTQTTCSTCESPSNPALGFYSDPYCDTCYDIAWPHAKRIESTETETTMQTRHQGYMSLGMNKRDQAYEKHFFDWGKDVTVDGWGEYIRVVKVAAKLAVAHASEKLDGLNPSSEELSESIHTQAVFLWMRKVVTPELYTEEYGMFYKSINSWNYGRISNRERSLLHETLREGDLKLEVEDMEDSGISLDLIEVFIADIWDVIHLTHKERAAKALEVMGETLEHPRREQRFSFVNEDHWPDTEGVFYGDGVMAIEV